MGRGHYPLTCFTACRIRLGWAIIPVADELVTSPSDLWFSLTKVSRTVVADASWYHVIISVLGIRRQK